MGSLLSGQRELRARSQHPRAVSECQVVLSGGEGEWESTEQGV